MEEEDEFTVMFFCKTFQIGMNGVFCDHTGLVVVR